MLALRLAPIFLIIAGNTLLHVPPLLLVGVIKALLPFEPVRLASNPLLTGLAESWIGVNNWMWRTFTHTRVELHEDAVLRMDGHYLVLANHQSWVDILVLQKVFNRRIPFMRFFLKRQLFWVPLLGLAWWALDFPFMGRYTRREIVRNPDLGRRDMEATRRACEKFRDIPVSVMNFVEGTRFTPEKHARQPSAYRHLLRPKAGGVAFVLDAMGGSLQGIVDVTIVYPGGRPALMDLLCDRVPVVRVHVEERPIPPDMVGADYETDAEYRERFQAWINALWADKDARIQGMLEPG
jgi:1-acyl-sn-glycerol-3-phosphate acyltransferase